MSKKQTPSSKPAISRNFLLITLFFTGASILIIEVLGARLLSPFFGVGLYVWSSLITVALSALAVGYSWGGKMADRSPTPQRMYQIILFSAIFTVVIPLISPFLLQKLSILGIKAGALAAGLLLFGPPLLLLGMVSPYGIKLIATELSVVGQRAGKLYAVSTLGSCFGALITGFWLIPNFGVDRIFYLVAAGLFFFWACQRILEKGKSQSLALIPVLLSVLVSFYSPAKAHKEKGVTVLHDAHSLYGHVRVYDQGERRWLMLDGAPNSGINRETQFPLTRYTYGFELMTFFHPQAQDALLVGLGGGSIANRFDQLGLAVDTVEIDPVVVEMAKDYFFYEPDSNQVFIEDARRYIRTSSKKYDLVIYDVFTGDLAPLHLFSQEALTEAQSVLKEGGILGVNTIGFVSDPDNRSTRSVYKTLKKVFPYVKIFLTKEKAQLNNILFFASNRPLEIKKDMSLGIPEIEGVLRDILTLQVTEWGPNQPLDQDGDALVLTDRYNPLQLWNLKASEQWRREIWDWYKD